MGLPPFGGIDPVQAYGHPTSVQLHDNGVAVDHADQRGFEVGVCQWRGRGDSPSQRREGERKDRQ